MVVVVVTVDVQKTAWHIVLQNSGVELSTYLGLQSGMQEMQFFYWESVFSEFFLLLFLGGGPLAKFQVVHLGLGLDPPEPEPRNPNLTPPPPKKKTLNPKPKPQTPKPKA